MNFVEFESEEMYEELLDEIDEDIGAAFARGEQKANDEMVEGWSEDY